MKDVHTDHPGIEDATRTLDDPFQRRSLAALQLLVNHHYICFPMPGGFRRIRIVSPTGQEDVAGKIERISGRRFRRQFKTAAVRVNGSRLATTCPLQAWHFLCPRGTS